MKNRSRIILAATGITLTTTFFWRLVSRRQALPCPSWLSWMLENPFMNSVAGADAILDRLMVEPGMKVLDIGCGPGRLTVPAAQRVGAAGQVTALDLQPEMLRRVQEKLDSAALTNVRLIHGGAGEGQVKPATVDRALLVTVLGEIPNREAALAEILQALKPGGILSITEVLPDPHYQTPGTIRRLAAQVGFQEVAYWGSFPAFTIHLQKPDPAAWPRIKVENLSPVSTTLLVPLYLRALESRRADGLIKDTNAVELVKRIDYDFSKLKGTLSGEIFALLRMREFDQRVRTFLNKYPASVIVDLGCGLDTRCFRLDNGLAQWYELDLPEVMALRDQLLGETPQCHLLRRSVLDLNWMDEIPYTDSQPILFLAEGVFPYLEPQAVKQLVTALCERFPGSELIFDALPPEFIRLMTWHPALKATQARMAWGLADAKELEDWHPGIRLLNEWFYFDQPEPRLRRYRWLKGVAPLSKTRIVQYRFNTPK